MAGIEWVAPEGPSSTGWPTARRTRGRTPWFRRPTVLLGVAFALALVGTGVGLTVHEPAVEPIAVSVAGSPVDKASATISAADKQFRAYARANGGALTAQSRCYFARLRPDSTDVATTIYCGPVLFAEGKQPAVYLAYEVTTTLSATGHTAIGPTAAGHIVLAPKPTPVSPVPVPQPAQQLERPDRTLPAPVPDRFAAPQALTLPPGTLTTFDVATLGDDFATTANSGMGSPDVVVQLEGAGYVAQVGAGAEIRRAPPGNRLLAFGLTVLSNGFGLLDQHYSVGLQVDGGAIRELHGFSSDGNLYSASADFVAVVPGTARSVQLVFDGAGFRQTLSLPGGKPGAGNIRLYAQPLSTTYDDLRTAEDVHLDEHGRRVDTAVDISVLNSQLVYFTQYGVVPSRRDHAFLHPEICLASQEINSSDECVELDASVLVLSVGGREIPARNIAPAGRPAYPVFEVTAGFTTGTLIARGSFTVNGVIVTFAEPFEYGIVLNG